MSVSSVLQITLNTLGGAALLWLLCTRSARLPLLCRLGFWAGACGLLLHALTLTADGEPMAEVGPGWLLPAGFWLLALGWWFAPAGQAIDAAMDRDRTPVAAEADDLDFTDYTRSKHGGHGA